MSGSRLAVAAAVPSAIGYAVPLAVGLATGHVGDGVAASAGALIVGFANLGGRYKVRSATLLAAAAAVGVAALSGGLAGPSVVATVVLMGVWGFAGGLVGALGVRPAFVGMLSTWALLLAGNLNLHGEAVLHEAWLMTAGGLVQTAVALLAWPLRPVAAERHAVADAYRTLASYARSPETATLQRTATALAAAAETVGAGPAVGGERGTLRALVEQGEWVRLELAALARAQASGVDRTLGAAATALDAIAAGRGRELPLADLQRNARQISEPVARRRASSLIGWITAAASESRAGAPRPEPPAHPMQDLKAEMTLRSSVFRHAVRLSVALMVGGLVYRGLSLGSGYWVPLTVLFVLRPDYGTTTARAIERAAGTLVGITIAWAIVTSFSPSSGMTVALLASLAYAAYALFPANYALFSVVLTVLIPLVFEFSGGSPVGALVDRVVDTGVGTAIALGAIVVWPTREAPRMRDRLAAYVVAEGRWLEAILNACAGGDQDGSLRSTRLAARRARTEAHNAVRLALAEPRSRRPDAPPLRSVLAAIDQISECALVLAATVHDGARAPRQALIPYLFTLHARFQEIASAMQTDAPGPETRPLTGAPDHDAIDPIIATVAAESTIVLTTLDRIDQTWRDSAYRHSQHRATPADGLSTG